MNGNGLGIAKFEESQPKRQEQLIASALAQSGDRNALTRAAHCDECDLIGIVVVCCEAGETFGCRCRKQRAGAQEHWILHGSPMAFDGAGSEFCGGRSGDPTL